MTVADIFSGERRRSIHIDYLGVQRQRPAKWKLTIPRVGHRLTIGKVLHEPVFYRTLPTYSDPTASCDRVTAWKENDLNHETLQRVSTTCVVERSTRLIPLTVQTRDPWAIESPKEDLATLQRGTQGHTSRSLLRRYALHHDNIGILQIQFPLPFSQHLRQFR
ncbi:uncharacterized protein BT62DRAFT_998405, partial [Guyanagaster necrorhizus]